MTDISFNCPKCGGHLVVDQRGEGVSVPCPHCRKAISIPVSSKATRPKLKDQMDKPPKTKQCPFCAEEILTAAIKCKHCGEFLNGGRITIPMKKSLSKTQKLLVPDPERVLWSSRPSYLYFVGELLVASVFVALFSVILIVAIGMEWSVGVGVIVVTAIAMFAKIFLARNSWSFSVSTKRITSTRGILSRKMREVGVVDIRNIILTQSILERLFKLGSIEIGSAGTAGVEVVLRGIPNAASVRDMIRTLKDEKVH